MTITRKLIVAGAGLATAAGLVAVPGAATASAGGLARFHQQKIVWKDCTLGPGDEVGKELDKAGVRCADVTVPLDYAKPGGRTIKVAISRLAATGKADRIGTMLINGGGPGPAIDMPPYIRGLMGDAGTRYDLIGMDPRSIGRSAPVDCGWPAGTWIRSAGVDRRGFDRAVAFARDLADRCARVDPELMRNISTRNAARDIDVVRAVLGERKISYNGASYGTYLGAVYAQMFPGRLDRTLLDSGVDPATWGPGLLKTTGAANERALVGFADWAARRNAEYGLGATRKEVLDTVLGVIQASARRPLRVGAYAVDDNVLPSELFNLVGSDREADRSHMAASLKVFKEAAAGRPARPHERLAEELEFVLTGKESQYGSAQVALLCGDAAGERDPEAHWRDVQRSRARHPVFGAVAHNINPCAFWPYTPREEPTRISAELPSLVVGATGDTRTVYQSSLALHRLLGGSHMVTLRGADFHAPYQAAYGNACLNDQVNTYLGTGVLPRKNVVCEK
ncbi:alpha/beta hydrolase [Actinomadura rudentiformis]|uniref:Alpha/beta hydrolase n=1 Tax=Actinomadura rudentiformis TaxID=359158 RepID=A0A6H9YNX0_9ACTN|nr:alpha/beta hydrolase [Actinomadura rudentiformis]KAB2348845.1 alpha/beta hydrolase [Actinomadura rudentiformis]